MLVEKARGQRSLERPGHGQITLKFIFEKETVIIGSGLKWLNREFSIGHCIGQSVRTAQVAQTRYRAQTRLQIGHSHLILNMMYE
jgi:hypothetical protein